MKERKKKKGKEKGKTTQKEREKFEWQNEIWCSHTTHEIQMRGELLVSGSGHRICKLNLSVDSYQGKESKVNVGGNRA